MDSQSFVSRLPFLVTALFYLITSGCASVAPAPFESFAKSVVQLHRGTDKALANIDEMSEERFLREVLADPIRALELEIEFDPDNPFAWQATPLFLKIEQFRDGIRQTTSALVGYSELLVRLASPDLLPKETFDKLTADLNANAYDAVVKISQTPPAAEEIALFSTLAVSAADWALASSSRALEAAASATD